MTKVVIPVATIDRATRVTMALKVLGYSNCGIRFDATSTYVSVRFNIINKRYWVTNVASGIVGDYVNVPIHTLMR